MSIHSKYFDSIRIGSGKKAKKEPVTVQCQWSGCESAGSHRAPAGRDREGEYFHFCIDHVREYNKNFNYFSDLSDGEIARLQKEAITGERPTWKTSQGNAAKASQDFSRLRSGSASYQNRVRDPFHKSSDQKAGKIRQRKLKTLEAKAFLSLGLEENATDAMIKAQYKALVKLLHPDVNGGDRSSEDRLREVLQAYNLLKAAGFC